MRKRHESRKEEPRRAAAGRVRAANHARAGALPTGGSGRVEAHREGGREVALRLGSPATERGSDDRAHIEGRLGDGKSGFTVGEITFARWLVHDLLRRLIDEAERKDAPEKDAAE